jgi:hypothetical protein
MVDETAYLDCRDILPLTAQIGDNKVNDASNFGLFKQNWGMLRVCATRAGFVGQSEGQWNNGAKLK